MYEEVEVMGPQVAKIIDIVGKRVMIIRRFPKGGVIRIQGYIGMPIFQNDHIKSEQESACCIEFLIGYRAIVGKGYEIVVTGHRTIEHVGNQTVGKALRLWQKIDKQKSQLQIQTNGGVIGIEG